MLLAIVPKFSYGQRDVDVRVITTADIPIPLASEVFSHVAVDAENKLWFGTSGDGLLTYDGDVWAQPAGQTGRTVRHIISDLDSNIWVASSRSGSSSQSQSGNISFFHATDATRNRIFVAGPDNSLLNEENIVSRLCWGLAVDTTNSVWAAHGTTIERGTPDIRRGGVGNYRGDGVWYKRFSGLFVTAGDRNVMAITTSGDRAWVSVNRSCISGDCAPAYIALYAKSGVELEKITFDSLPALADGLTFVRAILVDRKDNIWLGFSRGKGIARYNAVDKNWTFFTADNSNFPGGAFVNSQSIAEDGAGRVWIGTTNGLVMHDNVVDAEPTADTLTVYTTEDGLPNNSITGMGKQADSLWVTTLAGVARLYLPSEPYIVVDLIEKGGGQRVTSVRLSDRDEKNKFTYEVSIELVMDEKRRLATFSDLSKFEGDIKRLELLDASSNTLGYLPFKFRIKDMEVGRRKEVIVTLHNDLVPYQRHPIEGSNRGWNYVDKKISNSTELYPISMLVPPITDGGTPSYSLDSIVATKKPVLFVHGYTASDQYWGENGEALVNPAEDNFINSFRGKIDYLYTSYPGRVHQRSAKYAVWEFYYPSDQSWRESGYLLGQVIKEVTRRHNSQQVSIVAHSMGGLVTRAYVEETAEAFLPAGNSTGKIKYDKDIDRVLFLSTPHHGSFGGTRLYHEIYLPNLIQSLIKDPNAPAARDLGIGSPYLIELNDKLDLNNKNVEYLQIMGAEEQIFAKSPFCDGFILESKNHSDGIVSLSAGNLLESGIPIGYLPGFNHIHMNSPEEFGNTPVERLNKSKLPELIVAFLNDGTASTVVTNDLIEKKIFTKDNISTLSGSTVFEGCPINFDIGLPLVSFKDKDDKRINFLQNTGFEVARTGNTLTLVQQATNGRSNSAPGEWLYYSKSNYNEDDFKRSIFESTAFPDYEGLFYSYTKPDPIFFLPDDHEGVGWSNEGKLEETWNVNLGFSTATRLLALLTFSYARSNELTEKIRYTRLSTTYNDIKLPPHAVRVILSNQYIFPPASTDSTNFLIAAADSIYNYVDCEVTTATFMVDYGSQIAPDFELLTPDGNIVDATQADGSQLYFTHEPGLHTMYYTVMNPRSGRWYVRLNGSYTPDTSYRVVFPMQVTNPLQLRVDTVPNIPTSFLLRASLSNDSTSVARLTVSARLRNYAGEIETIILNDRGIDADSIAGDGIYSVVITLPSNDTYTIEVTASGNYITTSATVAADDCSFLRQASTTLTQSGLTTSTRERTVVTNPTAILQLSPNPTSGLLRVRYTTDIPQSWQLNIYNATGQVFTGLARGANGSIEELELDVSDLPAGLYFAVVRKAGGQFVTKKFVKQ